MSWLTERLARSLFAYRRTVYSFIVEDWGELSEHRRNLYRVEARQVLLGMLPRRT